MKPVPIALEGVSFAYQTAAGPIPVLEDVSLRMEAADYMGLIGPNGGGKTTLLKLILGLEHPDRGQVRLLGEPPARSRPRVGYVPQASSLEAATPGSVLDIVLAGRIGRSLWGCVFGSSHRRAALDALAAVGLADLASRPAGLLSGGQKQRVMLARALAAEAELLILDEPTAGVDPRAGGELTALLRELHRRLPILVVSHDIGFISSDVTRVACLNRTLVVHEADSLSQHALAAAYAAQVQHLHHGECCPVHGHAPHCTHEASPGGAAPTEARP